jgi:hypothetical protein
VDPGADRKRQGRGLGQSTCTRFIVGNRPEKKLKDC